MGGLERAMAGSHPRIKFGDGHDDLELKHSPATTHIGLYLFLASTSIGTRPPAFAAAVSCYHG